MKYLLGLFMNKIIFSLIIMFSSGFLHAEQLRFMLELGNKENLYLLDAESIEKSGKLVRVWMKTISNPKYIQSGQASYTHIVIHKSAGDPRATVKVVNFQGLT